MLIERHKHLVITAVEYNQSAVQAAIRSRNRLLSSASDICRLRIMCADVNDVSLDLSEYRWRTAPPTHIYSTAMMPPDTTLHVLGIAANNPSISRVSMFSSIWINAGLNFSHQKAVGRQELTRDAAMNLRFQPVHLERGGGSRTLHGITITPSFRGRLRVFIRDGEFPKDGGSTKDVGSCK